MTETAPASPTRHRYALPILAGLTALAVAACGSSPTASTSAQSAASGTPSTTAAAAPPKGGKDHVAGLIASVNNNTLTVTDNNVTSTIGFSPSTKISELTPASLTDATVGSCVTVRAARGDNASGGAMTAAAVTISAAKNGQCFANIKPAAAGSPVGHGEVRGTVTSVGNGSLVVTPADSSTPATVTLTGATTYAKRATATIQAITQGKCATARGTTDSSGTLQAEMIGLRPADNGKCPSMHH